MFSILMLCVPLILGTEEDKEDRRGTYVVREEVERAPVYTEPCGLVKTLVQVRIIMSRRSFHNQSVYRKGQVPRDQGGVVCQLPGIQGLQHDSGHQV